MNDILKVVLFGIMVMALMANLTLSVIYARCLGVEFLEGDRFWIITIVALIVTISPLVIISSYQSQLEEKELRWLELDELR